MKNILDFILKNKDVIIVLCTIITLIILLIKPLSPIVKILNRKAFIEHNKGRRFKKEYINWLIKEYKYATMVPSDYIRSEQTPKSPELEDIYINLKLRSSNENEIELPISQIIKKGAKTVILGDAGVGKTTFLRYMCLVYAKINSVPIFLYQKKQKLMKKYVIKNIELPIFVNLSKFNYSIKENEVPQDSLFKEMYNQLAAPLQSKYPNKYFEKLLESGKCILFLDGLDEISDADVRRSISNIICSISNSVHKDNTWIITSRPAGYKGNMQQHNFETALVGDLNPSQVESFVIQWYLNMSIINISSKSKRKQEMDEYKNSALQLVGFLKTNKGFSALTSRPMLLSLVTLLHSVKLKLPKNRALVYKDCVELLLERWDISKCIINEQYRTVTTKEKLSIIMHVANYMHNKKQNEIKRTMLINIIQKKISKMKIKLTMSIEELINNLEERSGLIISKGITDTGESVMAFSHLSFQEYLTALYMVSQNIEDKFIFSCSHDSWWREVILFYITLVNYEDALIILDKIYNKPYEENIIENTLLIADCFIELQHSQKDVLFQKVIGDIIFTYSCGNIEEINENILLHDEFNGFLIYLKSFFKRLNESQLDILSILINNRRGTFNIYNDEIIIGKYIRDIESKSVLSYIDFQLVDTLITIYKLNPSILADVFIKLDERIKIGRIANGSKNKISRNDLLNSAYGNYKWKNISLYSMQYNLKDIIDTSNFTMNIHNTYKWKSDMVNSIFSYPEPADIVNQSYTLNEDEPGINDFITLIMNNDIEKAIKVCANFKGIINFNNDQLSSLKNAYTRLKSFSNKCLIIILLSRVKEITPDVNYIFERYILEYTREVSWMNKQAGFGYKPFDSMSLQTIAYTLMRRVINKLESHVHTESDRDYAAFLLECSCSNIMEIREYSLMQIQRLNRIDEKFTMECLELLMQTNSNDRVCVLLYFLSHTDSRIEEVVKSIIPYLYNQEPYKYGYTVRDIAAYTIESLLIRKIA